MMAKQKRVYFVAILALFSVLLVRSTYAYFYGEDEVENLFQSGEAEVYLNEKFDLNDKWLPGEEKQKEVRFGNDGKIAAVLRVKFSLEQEVQEANLAQLKFAEGFAGEWEKHGEWYYYKKILNPGEMTGVTLKSITISDQIGNDEHGIQTDFSGITFHVCVKSEMLQASLASECAEKQGWEMIPDITEDRVQWSEN